MAATLVALALAAWLLRPVDAPREPAAAPHAPLEDAAASAGVAALEATSTPRTPIAEVPIAAVAVAGVPRVARAAAPLAPAEPPAAAEPARCVVRGEVVDEQGRRSPAWTPC